MQKQASSAWVQLSPMTVNCRIRALNSLSRESQLNTLSSTPNPAASQGRAPNSTVGCNSGS
ncbi:MAG: hypothetical protein V9G98_07830 [Candidatus Competibacter sp.]